MATERNVNNRGIRGDSPGPESAKMPDGYAASVTSLTGNKGLLGQSIGNPTARQDIPTGDFPIKEQYDFTSGGEPGLLGQDSDDYNGGAGGGGTRDDSERPSLPNPSLGGHTPVDWDSVAPYRYPEYPADSISVGGAATEINRGA